MIRDSEKSRRNWDEANKMIFDVITEKRPYTDLAKFALQAGNLHAKIVASEANMETNRLVMGKMIYTDPAELKKYVEKSMPQMMIEKK
jgi:hypothetical protein